MRRGAITRAAVSQLADARTVDAAATRPAALLVGAARRKSGAVGPAPPLLAHTVAANAQAVRTAVGTTGGGGAGCASPAGPTRALAVAALAAARAAERARANVAVDRLPPLVALAHVVHARTTARAVVWALPLSTAFTGPQVIAVADALLAARAVATAVVRADAHVARWPAVMRVALAPDLLCANLANAVAIDTQAAVWDLAVRPTPAREAEAGERAIACGADCTVSAADRVLGQGHRQQAERQDRNAHGGSALRVNFGGVNKDGTATQQESRAQVCQKANFWGIKANEPKLSSKPHRASPPHAAHTLYTACPNALGLSRPFQIPVEPRRSGIERITIIIRGADDRARRRRS